MPLSVASALRARCMEARASSALDMRSMPGRGSGPAPAPAPRASCGPPNSGGGGTCV